MTDEIDRALMRVMSPGATHTDDVMTLWGARLFVLSDEARRRLKRVKDDLRRLPPEAIRDRAQ